MQIEHYLAHLQRFGIKPGLDRIRALLARAGRPQRRYPVVLIGGTNGKGSTCQFLARQLAAEGRRVGLYTSPHLYRWHERIQTLGPDAPFDPHSPFPHAIGEDEFDALLEEAMPHIEAVAATHGQPTEFETLTLLGLWHFARKEVEVAVVEVGLGGRWDATNATDPQVSVITHVALDHCDRLGDTIAEIAADKVEIARPGRFLVTADTNPESLQVMRDHAIAEGFTLWPWRAETWSNDPAACRALAPVPLETVGSGDFQLLNWTTARTARLALEHTLPATEVAAGRPTAEKSAKRTGGSEDLGLLPAMDEPDLTVPGRLEVLREHPKVLIDGANNPDGALFLADFLRRELRGTEGKLILVLGILADKDYAAMTATLAPLAAAVIATQSDSPRAAAAETVAGVARQHCERVEIVMPVNAAVRRALELARPEDIVCVTGSFYTIAEVDRAVIRDWTCTS